MSNLLYGSLRQGCFWHLVPGQIVRKLPQSRHGTCMPATVIQFFEMSEEH
jgi:hypothetical protein